MSEDSKNEPITPEVVLPNVVRSRNSEGKLIVSKGRATKETDPRRASTGSFRNGGTRLSSGKPSPLNNGENTVPHYLRASTGSCHDFCKYGKKHESEVKPWQVKTRKMIKPTLHQLGSSEFRDLSQNKITKVVKSNPFVSSSLNPSSVSGIKISSPSNDLKIPSRPNSAKGNTMMVNEKKKNFIEKRITPVLSGKRDGEIKLDKTKVTSKEANTKLVSFPVVARPSCKASSFKAKAKGDKNIVSPIKISNKVIKTESKLPTSNTVEEKTLHIIKNEGKNTILELRETNQEGSKEVENKLVDIGKVIDDTMSVPKVGSEILVIKKHDDNTFDTPSIESFSSSGISSPVIESFSSSGISSPVKSQAFSYDEDDNQDDVDDIDSNNRFLESKPNEKYSNSPQSDNIPSPVKPLALSYGKKDSQDEIAYTDTEKRVTEMKQNERTTDSSPSESFSLHNIIPIDKSLALLYEGEESQDEVECTTDLEKKSSELKQIESSIDSPPSESFSSQNIISLDKFPELSYGEEEAQDEVEYTNCEKKIPELKEKGNSSDSFSSESTSPDILSKTPSLLYGEKEPNDELDFKNSEKKVPESKQNESTVESISSETLSSLNISSLFHSSALMYGDGDDHDEVVYLYSETEGYNDCISESSGISDEEETSVNNQNKRTRKAKIVSEEDDPARTLKFRRGKVIEVESDNTGPRRLKFRKVKILGEKQENASKSHRRSYQKRGFDHIDDKKDDSEKVVLRHQEVEGKKDSQGLFNNVIEETAIKLAETRKSKVKALVGAFETVISLQESKPSTQSASL